MPRLLELVRAAAQGGVDAVHLRARDAPASLLVEWATAARQVLNQYPRTLLLVNDRLDVAILSGADGVHLPERSFPPTLADEIRGLAGREGFVVGRSVHSADAVAEPGTEELDYIVFGHVFATPSKQGMAPRGVEALARAARASSVPMLAIGGISPENAAQAIRAGAAGVVVKRAIVEAQDPSAAAWELRRRVDAAWRGASVDNRFGNDKQEAEAQEAMLQVSVNGKVISAPPGATLRDLLEAHGIDPHQVAVAHNEEIVEKGRLGEITLREGDAVEIVRVMAGG
ncbi:MAG: sulfur carrier protein ThiS [Firmicutes bacterium]|nr:sulfur carrier protein ThiS [Bacillota bacterium]